MVYTANGEFRKEFSLAIYRSHVTMAFPFALLKFPCNSTKGKVSGKPDYH